MLAFLLLLAIQGKAFDIRRYTVPSGIILFSLDDTIDLVKASGSGVMLLELPLITDGMTRNNFSLVLSVNLSQESSDNARLVVPNCTYGEIVLTREFVPLSFMGRCNLFNDAQFLYTSDAIQERGKVSGRISHLVMAKQKINYFVGAFVCHMFLKQQKEKAIPLHCQFIADEETMFT